MMMTPLSIISQAFLLVKQEERQRQIGGVSSSSLLLLLYLEITHIGALQEPMKDIQVSRNQTLSLHTVTKKDISKKIVSNSLDILLKAGKEANLLLTIRILVLRLKICMLHHLFLVTQLHVQVLLIMLNMWLLLFGSLNKQQWSKFSNKSIS